MLAIKEVSDLPIMVTLTYNEDGRTLFGTPPETAVVVLQSLGVDAIGVNCSTGPAEMIALVEKWQSTLQCLLLQSQMQGFRSLRMVKLYTR